MQLQQTIFRIALAFVPSPAPDMDGRDGALYQGRTNQQKTMTVQRIFLGTHQDDWRLLRIPEKSVEALQEVWRLPARRVVHEPVLAVITRVQRPATELIAKKLIDDFGVCQLSHQWLAVELRKPEAPRAAAHVANHLDFMATQNAQQVRHLLVGVPDGE